MLAILSNNVLTFNFEFLSNTNFGLAYLTLLVYSTINYNDKIDNFTIRDRYRENWFETIL